jgi:hypothetical protein
VVKASDVMIGVDSSIVKNDNVGTKGEFAAAHQVDGN